MDNFNFNLFKYFYYVVYYKGFTNAARHLNVVQSALSYNVKTLENLSGIEMYSFKEITELISDKINGNVSKEKTKVLRKRSDNDETNNY